MVCLPKQVGGMSVTNIKFHNHALLTKWTVKLYTDTSCLWTTFVINIYSKGRSGRGPLVLKKRGSFFWKALLSLRSICFISLRWTISDDSMILLWEDNWGNITLASTVQRGHRLFVSLKEA
jgi:hypothetical protein